MQYDTVPEYLTTFISENLRDISESLANTNGVHLNRGTVGELEGALEELCGKSV